MMVEARFVSVHGQAYGSAVAALRSMLNEHAFEAEVEEEARVVLEDSRFAERAALQFLVATVGDVHIEVAMV